MRVSEAALKNYSMEYFYPRPFVPSFLGGFKRGSSPFMASFGSPGLLK